MPNAREVTISYRTFSELWKRLVSRRKARKLGVDRESLWERLAAGNSLRFDAAERGDRGDDDDGRPPAPAPETVDATPAEPLDRGAEVDAAVATRKRAPATKRTAGKGAVKTASVKRPAGGKTPVKTTPKKSPGTARKPVKAATRRRASP